MNIPSPLMYNGLDSLQAFKSFFDFVPDPLPTLGSDAVPDWTASYIGLLKSLVLLDTASKLNPSIGAVSGGGGPLGNPGELNSTLLPCRKETLCDDAKLVSRAIFPNGFLRIAYHTPAAAVMTKRMITSGTTMAATLLDGFRKEPPKYFSQWLPENSDKQSHKRSPFVSSLQMPPFSQGQILGEGRGRSAAGGGINNG